jgi:hypothetical protein
MTLACRYRSLQWTPIAQQLMHDALLAAAIHSGICHAVHKWSTGRSLLHTCVQCMPTHSIATRYSDTITSCWQACVDTGGQPKQRCSRLPVGTLIIFLVFEHLHQTKIVTTRNKGIFKKTHTQREEVEEAKWVGDFDFWIHRRLAQLTQRFITR